MKSGALSATIEVAFKSARLDAIDTLSSDRLHVAGTNFVPPKKRRVRHGAGPERSL